MAGEEENGDLEVLFVADGEPLEEPAVADEKPAVRTLTDDEYNELVRKADAASALASPLGSLVERLDQNQQRQVPANYQQPTETEEEFAARMEQQAFLPGQFGKVIDELTTRKIGPVVARMSDIIISQSKQIMRSDPERGEMFRKFEKDIDQEAANLPRTVDIYEKAYEKVMLRKQPELLEQQRIADREQIKKELMAELAAAGVVLPQEGEQRKAAIQSLGQRAGSGNASGGSGSKRISLYESEAQRMLDIGMDPKNAQQVERYLANHPRRK